MISSDNLLKEIDINWLIYPKNPDPSLEKDRWSQSHPQNKNVGVIRSLAHTWILRDSYCVPAVFVYLHHNWVFDYLLNHLVVSISLQIFTQRIGEDEPILMSMFIDRWCGSNLSPTDSSTCRNF